MQIVFHSSITFGISIESELWIAFFLRLNEKVEKRVISRQRTGVKKSQLRCMTHSESSLREIKGVHLHG